MFCLNFVVFVLFCNSVVNSSSLSRKINGFNNSVISRQEDISVPQQKWITEIFDEAKNQFSMVENVTENCRNDYLLYLQHLRNQSVWAVRMLESSEWPTMSVLAGNKVFMGNWFECRLISAYGIDGQFCFANVTYDYDDKEEYEIVEIPPQESSAWNAIKMFHKDPARLSRQQLKWGLCIPSSCTIEDLKNSLNNQMKPIFEKYKIRIQADVDPDTCSKKEKLTSSPLQMFKYGAVFYIVVLVMCTIYNSKNDETKKNTLGKKLLDSLSLTRNMKSLLNPTSPVQRAAHSIKAITTIGVLYAHLNLYLLGYPKYNAEKIELEYKIFSTDLYHSALTDLFFMVSGYLAFDFGMKAASKGGALCLTTNFLTRWIRLTGTLGVVIYLIIFVVPYLGDGPLWKFYMSREIEYCSENWWASIFSLANIFNVERQCLIISWYISVDIHLALISSIVLYIMNKNFKAGIILATLVFILGMVITFAVVYIKRLNGVFLFYLSALEDTRNSDDFNYQYITTFSRITPYFTGFFAAIAAQGLLKRNIRISIVSIRIFFFGGLVLADMYQIYSILFYQYGREYNVLENAIYAATHRWIFVAPFAFGLCCISSSDIDKFFVNVTKSKISHILGRLSFSTFVLNTAILLFIFSVQADLMPTSNNVNVFFLTAALILISYLFGFLFYILVEAPIANVAKIFTGILYSLCSASNSPKKSIAKPEGTFSKDNDTRTMNSAVNKGFDSLPISETGKIFNVMVPKSSVVLVSANNENHKF